MLFQMPIQHRVSFDKKKCPDDPAARKRTPGCALPSDKPFAPQTRHPKPGPGPDKPPPFVPGIIPQPQPDIPDIPDIPDNPINPPNPVEFHPGHVLYKKDKPSSNLDEFQSENPEAYKQSILTEASYKYFQNTKGGGDTMYAQSLVEEYIHEKLGPGISVDWENSTTDVLFTSDNNFTDSMDISIRGTQIGGGDMEGNVRAKFGTYTESEKYKNIKKVAISAQEYHNINIETIGGHSAGGGAAHILADDVFPKAKAIGFNSSIPGDYKTKFKDSPTVHEEHRMTGDALAPIMQKTAGISNGTRNWEINTYSHEHATNFVTSHSLDWFSGEPINTKSTLSKTSHPEVGSLVSGFAGGDAAIQILNEIESKLGDPNLTDTQTNALIGLSGGIASEYAKAGMGMSSSISDKGKAGLSGMVAVMAAGATQKELEQYGALTSGTAGGAVGGLTAAGADLFVDKFLSSFATQTVESGGNPLVGFLNAAVIGGALGAATNIEIPDEVKDVVDPAATAAAQSLTAYGTLKTGEAAATKAYTVMKLMKNRNVNVNDNVNNPELVGVEMTETAEGMEMTETAEEAEMYLATAEGEGIEMAALESDFADLEIMEELAPVENVTSKIPGLGGVLAVGAAAYGITQGAIQYSKTKEERDKLTKQAQYEADAQGVYMNELEKHISVDGHPDFDAAYESLSSDDQHTLSKFHEVIKSEYANLGNRSSKRVRTYEEVHEEYVAEEESKLRKFNEEHPRLYTIPGALPLGDGHSRYISGNFMNMEGDTLRDESVKKIKDDTYSKYLPLLNAAPHADQVKYQQKYITYLNNTSEVMWTKKDNQVLSEFDANYKQHIGDFNDLANMYTNEKEKQQQNLKEQQRLAREKNVMKTAHDNHLLTSEYKSLLKDISSGQTESEATDNLHTLQVDNMQRFGFFSANTYTRFVDANPNNQTFKQFHNLMTYAGHTQTPPVFSQPKFQSIYEKSRSDAQDLKKNVDSGYINYEDLHDVAKDQNMNVKEFMHYITYLGNRPESLSNKTIEDANQKVNHSNFNENELEDLAEGNSVTKDNSVFAAA